ncbi:MAG: carboxymuconolactone decarboxylase family protein [Gammaproteobacteria bacterium]|nr:carboxymuconolactone decarboxylase family protein [Gammaproteobacteria bacterium]
MSTFTIFSSDNAPVQSQPLLRSVQNKYGFVPNLFGSLAISPAALEAYINLGEMLETSSLDAVEQQIVLIATSVENGCEYCVAAHSLVAKQMVKVSPVVVDALRGRTLIPDAKLQALAAFTRAVVANRGEVDKASLEAFFAAGYGNQQVLEVILGVTMKTLSNYANNLMNTLLDDPFKPETWEG